MQNYYQWILSIIIIKTVNEVDMTRFFIILHQTINNVINLPSSHPVFTHFHPFFTHFSPIFHPFFTHFSPIFHPFFVLKLEVQALLQNVCNGICGVVVSKIFSGEDSPRHPYDSRAFSARSRTNYFKLATPLAALIEGGNLPLPLYRFAFHYYNHSQKLKCFECSS